MNRWILIGLAFIISIFVISLIYFVVSTDDYDCVVNNHQWWKWSYYFPTNCVDSEDND